MSRPLFALSLLILALLSAQLGAAAHGIAHTLGEQSQDADRSLPHDKHCDLCAAYAQIGSAIGSNGIVFGGTKPDTSAHQYNEHRHISSTFVAFAARAPPASA